MALPAAAPPTSFKPFGELMLLHHVAEAKFAARFFKVFSFW